jgi:hypothetical protein
LDSLSDSSESGDDQDDGLYDSESSSSPTNIKKRKIGSKTSDSKPPLKSRSVKTIATSKCGNNGSTNSRSATPTHINKPISSTMSQSPMTIPTSLHSTPIDKKPIKSNSLLTPLTSQSSVSQSTPAAIESESFDGLTHEGGGGGVFGAGQHEHDKWEFWLNRRDINKKYPSDPEYNPRTLFVPQNFLNEQTPAMKQWFEMKMKNMDTVLFFKV